MPLAATVRDLTDRILSDLASARDYLEHTKAIWRLVEELAAQGQAVEFPIPQTGMAMTAAELATRAERYVGRYLNESVFQHLIALFEDFVFELLRLWLTAYPGGIPEKGKKPVDLATIIDAPDRDAILRIVIDRELNALKYERPTAWFRYLNDRVKLGIPTDEQIERFAELKAARDILAHNRGVVNQTYLDKAGRYSRYRLGQRLEIPEPYLHDAWQSIRTMVEELSSAAITRA